MERVKIITRRMANLPALASTGGVTALGVVSKWTNPQLSLAIQHSVTEAIGQRGVHSVVGAFAGAVSCATLFWVDAAIRKGGRVQTGRWEAAEIGAQVGAVFGSALGLTM